MNDKRSSFGIMCDMFRLKNGGMSQKEMGKELGYTQSQISQYERKIDVPEVETTEGMTKTHNGHKDPPLEYVEKVVKLFKLNRSDRFNLLWAALESSQEIRIAVRDIKFLPKEYIIKLIICIICDKKAIFDEYYNITYTKVPDLDSIWGKIKSGIDDLVNRIK